MQAIERVTLVLRAKPGETLAPLLQHISLGAPVAVGTGVAIISGASDRDAMEPDQDGEGFCIDAHARLALDAARYRWLRDVAFDTPRQDLALRDRHGNMLIEDELDAEIDRAMRESIGEQTTAEASQDVDCPDPITDALALEIFFKRMTDKMIRSARSGRSGWQGCSEGKLNRMLHAHIAKGDPVDVANFCMMLSALGYSTTPCHADSKSSTGLIVDPRNLFASINPIGASADELEQGRSGFVDERTHADYLIFLAGYRAALEAEPCES